MAEINVVGACRWLRSAAWTMVVVGAIAACACALQGVGNPVVLLFVGIFVLVFILGLLAFLAAAVLKIMFNEREGK